MVDLHRGAQGSGLQRQNDFLKSYVARLQQQLIDYMGTHLPPPTSTLTGSVSRFYSSSSLLIIPTTGEGDRLEDWIGDGGHVSPLLAAYDRRIAELSDAHARVATELDTVRVRARQAAADCDRLTAEAKRLAELAAQRLDDRAAPPLAAAGGAGASRAVRGEAGLLAGENEVLMEENRLLRLDLERAQADLAEQARPPPLPPARTYARTHAQIHAHARMFTHKCARLRSTL
jgi:hypothetical protein